ncbi:MAG: phenylalanine--tRNA ligase subunit beta [Gallionellales bacterium RIFCSPLOWO2_12_FULL_59_22]|nr:MAG: phenylalanine--tRNA ligase subunit beta [Gallionellales bacterium RIFCSPLOWO2_02_FULL_59_110]OGT05769.1 MAG: phenylalanine--tRNA ligase subunit beta [Gallionellales bacterium RIFCSPLOWO2_02_58_13]OGT13567.1 MAG: phenylalanine--tRNA ligase subunit beta [Gallionellales bacterium RIFCSPLOWO2_12_FULL_59_22]
MKFSENWLRTWVNPELSSEALAHTLTMAGLEVEALEAVAPAFDNVVVAEVLEVVKHPNADRLNVCKVNVGEAQPLTIVCGAANVAVGVKVPCGRIGAVLPGEFAIKQAKVRNVESFGMLCSEKELGLAEESQGLWLLPADAPVGKTLREYLELDDKLFTLKLTPNRSDCSGMVGVAREVAALTGSPLKPLEIQIQPVTLTEQLPVHVADGQACPLYCGRLVRGVNAAAPTPTWMLRRLERSGLRGISAVVDITNYVMLEMGQPLHAFDAAQLSGGISVRRARNGEGLTLLNEQAVVLDEEVLVIADDARVLALAGIMGGQGSGVETITCDVFLESAFFNPDAIAGKARRFGLATDSSFRFERGVDFSATHQALERATQLLLEICGGSAGAISEVRDKLPQRAAITLRRSRVARVLGITLDNIQIATLLKRLQLDFVAKDDDFSVMPPSFRFDLSIEADLIEELARLYGYDNIPAQAPQAALNMLPYSESQRPLARIQQTLVARDYQEIVSYAFVEEQVERELCGNEHLVALQNPIASNLSVMRSSLIGGLVGALRFNLNRKQVRVRLFEAGACFAKVNGEYVQSQQLSGLAYGAALPEQWGAVAKSVDFYDVKADIEALFAPQLLRFVAATHPALHPGRSAQIYCGTQAVGWIGELHPRWQQQYDMAQPAVWFEVELGALTRAAVPHMSEIAKSLPVRRDLAVVVDEAVTAQALLDAMQQAAAPYTQGIALFDVYRGKGIEQGKKSLAFRVLLQDTQKTLADSEIEASIALLVDALQQYGAQLRM